MNNKSKIRADVAASARTWTEDRTPGGSTIFRNHFTPDRAGRQGLIEGLLRPGAANAIQTSQLVELAEFRSARELQAAIAREREAGALICSKSGNGGGYFLAATREELRAFEKTLTRRAVSTLAALKSTRKALERLDGQTELPGVR